MITAYQIFSSLYTRNAIFFIRLLKRQTIKR